MSADRPGCPPRARPVLPALSHRGAGHSARRARREMSIRAQARRGRSVDDGRMSTPLRPRTTNAFMAQAGISFGISLSVTIVGIGYLQDSRWVRAFLALGVLYVVTSAFTLAKVIRDRQEETAIVSRVDQARLDKLLAEQDLLRINNP